MKKPAANIKYRILSVLSVISVLFIWELVTDILHLISPMMLPSPAKVLNTFIYKLCGGVNPDGATLLQHIAASMKIALGGYVVGVVIGKHTMPYHIGISLYRVGVAFSIATVTGILLGVSMGYSKTAEAIIKPIFEFIRPIPPLAWIPMSILWFGLGDQSKFFIIFLGCFCFVTVNTYDGTKNVDPVLLGAARMLGASERQVFFHVVLPASIPYIFAGLQIAITAGWSAVVGAEMVRSDEGVGWIIVMGMSNGNTVQIMVGMIAIGIVGYVLATLMAKLEGRLCRWNKQQGI